MFSPKIKSHTNLQNLEAASRQLKTDFPNILIEASGGISEENAEQYALETVDIISTSSLVQGYEVVDFSMKISKYEGGSGST